MCVCLWDLHECIHPFAYVLGTSPCTSGGLRLVIGITIFIEAGSQSNPEMICKANLASQLALGASCFCLLRVEL